MLTSAFKNVKIRNVTIEQHLSKEKKKVHVYTFLYKT